MHKQVLVLRLETANSIEQRVATVARNKRAFADRSITGDLQDRVRAVPKHCCDAVSIA